MPRLCLPALVAGLVVAFGLIAAPAGAYQLTARDYEKLGLELPPYDHDGRQAEGTTRNLELQQINQQIDEREHRLEVVAFEIKRLTERGQGDSARVASLRQDYATQMESYKRWRESAELRRQALLGSVPHAPLSEDQALQNLGDADADGLTRTPEHAPPKKH